MAFFPACKRERESAASHALAIVGVSMVGVEVDSITAVAMGDVVGVAGSVTALVAVGEGTELAAGVDPVISVSDDKGLVVGSATKAPVEEGTRVDVSSDGCVSVTDEIGDGVNVNAGEVDEAGAVVGLGVSCCSVTAGSSEGLAKILVGNKVEVDPAA